MVKKITIVYALGPFLSRPNESLHLADISRSLNEPHPTVRQWLNLLEKKGILKKSFKGRLTLYSLNVENALLFEYLIIAEKLRLIEKCEQNLILKEILDFIKKNFNESKVLIFGSAVDSLNKANDIDLLIIGAEKTNDLEKFTSKLGKNTHIIHVKSFDAISNSLKTEIIKRHLIIKGADELVRWLF
ncbi:MAG: nucleotidyltransferase domain-containing protein [Nanoarchaeota archaeon]|nr:nucleotidyltransferase domain-containing protein [Nanoarchaeota archaeon]